MAAAVFHYCHMINTQNTQCTVILDDLVWPAEDRAPRPVRHASYNARIFVPAPHGHDLNAQTAAEAGHQVEENPEAFAAEVHELLYSDDETQLTQTCVSRPSSQRAYLPLPRDVDAIRCSLENTRLGFQADTCSDASIPGAVLQPLVDLPPTGVSDSVSSACRNPWNT